MRRLPHIFKPVGVPFERNGRMLVAVERPKDVPISETCSGCVFLPDCSTALACSSFDREDKKNIWFKEYTQTT